MVYFKYIFTKFFFPGNDSTIQDYKKLSNEAMETLLNKLYSLDQEQNGRTINEYMKQINLKWLQ